MTLGFNLAPQHPRGTTPRPPRHKQAQHPWCCHPKLGAGAALCPLSIPLFLPSPPFLPHFPHNLPLFLPHFPIFPLFPFFSPQTTSTWALPPPPPSPGVAALPSPPRSSISPPVRAGSPQLPLPGLEGCSEVPEGCLSWSQGESPQHIPQCTGVNGRGAACPPVRQAGAGSTGCPLQHHPWVPSGGSQV